MKEIAIKVAPVAMIAVSLGVGYAITTMDKGEEQIAFADQASTQLPDEGPIFSEDLIVAANTQPVAVAANQGQGSLFDAIQVPGASTQHGFVPSIGVPGRPAEILQNNTSNAMADQSDLQIATTDAGLNDVMSHLDSFFTKEELSGSISDNALPVIEASTDEVMNQDLDCQPLMNVEAEPGAMIRVLMSAPCNAGEFVEFDHAGVQFGQMLDDQGNLVEYIPAMTSTAEVSAKMSDGFVVSGSAMIDDVSNYRRMAVVGEQAVDLELHAWSNGADFGEQGHVYFGNPGSVESIEGHLTVLGSTTGERPFFTQIFSAPVFDGAVGSPEITVEAVVSDMNCGEARNAKAIVSDRGNLGEVSVELPLPGCDWLGEIMVMPVDIDQIVTASLN